MAPIAVRIAERFSKDDSNFSGKHELTKSAAKISCYEEIKKSVNAFPVDERAMRRECSQRMTKGHGSLV